MLLAHYLPKIITALFGGLFIFAGVYTFGNALIFDRIFIGVLIFTAIVCRKNVNVLGVLVILVIQRVLEEFGWVVIGSEYLYFVKVMFYLIAAWLCYKMHYDLISKMLLLCLIAAMGSELYWFIYDIKPPLVHWFVFTVVLTLLARHMIFLRVSLTEDYFPNKGESINLDWQIYKLNGVAAAVQSIVMLEYLLRNLLSFFTVKFFYSITPYVMHAIATYAIWVIFHESYKLLIPKLLRA